MTFIAGSARHIRLVTFILVLSVQVLWSQPNAGNAPTEKESIPEGTWVNMRFIEDLKANKSLTKALGILRPNELLVLRAVRQTDSVLLFYTSRELDEGTPTDIVITQRKGLGEQRRITAFGETWLLGITRARGEFMALHSTIDSTAKPDVFAYIPSKNQNADFIYQRILNSSTLTGSYTDAKGKKFTFSSLQHAVTPKLEFNYRILPAPGKPYQIMEIVSDKPKRVRYAYEWKGETLVISTFNKNGTTKPLYKLKRN